MARMRWWRRWCHINNRNGTQGGVSYKYSLLFLSKAFCYAGAGVRRNLLDDMWSESFALVSPGTSAAFYFFLWPLYLMPFQYVLDLNRKNTPSFKTTSFFFFFFRLAIVFSFCTEVVSRSIGTPGDAGFKKGVIKKDAWTHTHKKKPIKENKV